MHRINSKVITNVAEACANKATSNKEKGRYVRVLGVPYHHLALWTYGRHATNLAGMLSLAPLNQTWAARNLEVLQNGKVLHTSGQM
jgi:hypothetical protein